MTAARSTADLRRRVIRRMLGTVRLAPERINEDSDAAAGRAQILNLVRRDPVVNRSAADADHLACLHDAHCLPFHWGCPPKMNIGYCQHGISRALLTVQLGVSII